MKCPYYSTDDDSDLLAGQNVKDFTTNVLCLNVRSIIPLNLEEFLIDFGLSMPFVDVCCFTETRLSVHHN